MFVKCSLASVACLLLINIRVLFNTSGLSKRGKIYHFNNEWEVQYCFNNGKGRCVCLLYVDFLLH